MRFRHAVGGTTHVFEDLRELMAQATPLRSGDQLAGVAAASAEERVAAQWALADVPLRHVPGRGRGPLRGATRSRA